MVTIYGIFILYNTELLAELLKFNTTSFRKHYEKGKIT